MRRTADIFGAMTLSRPAWATGHDTGLLRQVLDYCLHHPEPESRLEREAGPIELRECLGETWVVGEAPRFLEITAELLNCADPRRMSFTGGVLTLHVKPWPLRYRPCHQVHNWMTVVFELLDAPATH